MTNFWKKADNLQDPPNGDVPFFFESKFFKNSNSVNFELYFSWLHAKKY